MPSELMVTILIEIDPGEETCYFCAGLVPDHCELPYRACLIHYNEAEEAVKMSNFKERVIEERDELHKKLYALGEFIKKKQPAGISDAEWDRLKIQERLMSKYLIILNMRINTDFA